jgi:hypothetical protein
MLKKAFSGRNPPEIHENILRFEPRLELEKFKEDPNYRFYALMDKLITE